MNQVQSDEVRQNVRNRYKQIAVESSPSASCCTPTTTSSSCCGTANEVSAKLGYSNDELTAVPDGSNLGLGCGNPQAIASLKPGEVVLDLGSGAGLDCFLASKKVGGMGKVYGVDMTPEMVSLSLLPISDHSIDVIISNCVINLSPDKQQVFNEAFRVLKTGGRLAISDVVLTAELPNEIRDNPDSLASCVSGASTVNDIREMLQASGFKDISVEAKNESRSVALTKLSTDNRSPWYIRD